MKHPFWFMRSATASQPVAVSRKRPPPPFDRAIRLHQLTLAERECPITFEKILEQPPQECVIFIDGNIYKKQALLRWLQDRPVSPSSNLALNYYSKLYKLPTEPVPSCFTSACLYMQAAVLIFIACSAVIGTGLLTTYPLHNKTTQAYVVGVLFSVFFLSISYLCCCLFNMHEAAAARAIAAHSPLLNADAPTLTDVYQRYHLFLLEYDPDYYLPQDNASETSRPTPSV